MGRAQVIARMAWLFVHSALAPWWHVNEKGHNS